MFLDLTLGFDLWKVRVEVMGWMGGMEMRVGGGRSDGGWELKGAKRLEETIEGRLGRLRMGRVG